MTAPVADTGGSEGEGEIGTRRLSDQERVQVENNLALVERLGDLVGSWERGSAQCRRTGFTATVKFEKHVDPFEVDEFIEMMVTCPGLYAPTLRRLIELDDEVKRLVPPNRQTDGAQ